MDQPEESDYECPVCREQSCSTVYSLIKHLVSEHLQETGIYVINAPDIQRFGPTSSEGEQGNISINGIETIAVKEEKTEQAKVYNPTQCEADSKPSVAVTNLKKESPRGHKRIRVTTDSPSSEDSDLPEIESPEAILAQFSQLSCVYCPFEADAEEEIHRHLMRNHYSLVMKKVDGATWRQSLNSHLSCSQCYEKMPDILPFLKHVQTCRFKPPRRGKRSFYCLECLMTFKSYSALNIHKRERHIYALVSGRASDANR